MSYLDFNVSFGDLSVHARTSYLDDPHQIHETATLLHEHVMYEAYFIEDGFMSLRCNGDMIQLKKNDILIINIHIPHKVESYDASLRRLNVRFTYKSTGTQPPYQFISLPESTRATLSTLIELINHSMNRSHASVDYFRAHAAFSILLSHLLEHMLPIDATGLPAQPQTPSRVDHCVLIDQFFQEHYAEPVTSSDLAKFLKYSKTQANRILFEHSGMFFAEKLSKTRILAAKRYLKYSNLPIDEIAERCGYQSRKGFECMFKKQMHVSPHQYRANHQPIYQTEQNQ